MECTCVPHPTQVGEFESLCAAHAQMLASAIATESALERERCAKIAETFLDGKTDNISCIQSTALDKVATAIRNRSK